MLLLVIISMLQELPPPAPTSSPPSPVGDMPIDSNIGFLMVAAMIIAIWFYRKQRLANRL